VPRTIEGEGYVFCAEGRKYIVLRMGLMCPEVTSGIMCSFEEKLA
jgi:hypothetical protein